MNAGTTRWAPVVIGGMLLVAQAPCAAGQAAAPLVDDAGQPPTDPQQRAAEVEVIEEAKTEDAPPFTMRFGASIQVRASYEELSVQGSYPAMQIRRARASLSGIAYDRFDYAIQAELAGAGARLLDANVRTRILPNLTLWAGQGKAPFGRQQLTSSGNLQFVDRSIVDARFAAGRQLGVALMGRLPGGLLDYAAGVYNGDGIGLSVNPVRRFMTVGRVVVTPFGAYQPVESAHDYPSSPRLALGLAGMTNSVGLDDDRLDVARLNGEAAFRIHGLSVTAEVYREWARAVDADRLTTDGWYLQPGFLFPGKTHEFAARYAAVGMPAGVGGLVETGVAYSYYLRAHSAKVQADVRNIRDQATGDDRREVRLQFQLTL